MRESSRPHDNHKRATCWEGPETRADNTCANNERRLHKTSMTHPAPERARACVFLCVAVMDMSDLSMCHIFFPFFGRWRVLCTLYMYIYLSVFLLSVRTGEYVPE